MSESDKPEIKDFGTPAQLLKFIQERSDDFQKVIVTTTPFTVRYEGNPIAKVNCGMVLYFLDGKMFMISKENAEIVLNDGILSRMKIPIELRG